MLLAHSPPALCAGGVSPPLYVEAWGGELEGCVYLDGAGYTERVVGREGRATLRRRRDGRAVVEVRREKEVAWVGVVGVGAWGVRVEGERVKVGIVRENATARVWVNHWIVWEGALADGAVEWDGGVEGGAWKRKNKHLAWKRANE